MGTQPGLQVLLRPKLQGQADPRAHGCVMSKEASSVELKELVKKLVHNSMGESISRQAQGIYPMRDIGIRKVKLIKAPRYDPAKLLELHGEGKKKVGKKVKA